MVEILKTLVHTFNVYIQESIGLKENRPGKAWMRSLLQMHSISTLHRSVKFEAERADVMNPHNVASHFAKTKALMDKYGINDTSRIRNLDESGLSIIGMKFGRSKCFV